MKKVLFVMVIVILIISMVACGKARENAVENMIENMIEKESGEDVDIKVDDGGDSIKIETEDGDVTIEGDEGGMAWPADKLPAGFPKLKGATVTAVIDAGTGLMIGFEDCTEKAADDFMKNFSSGAWKVTMEMESEGQKIIMANKGEEEFIQFGWSPEDGEGSITYGTN